MGRGANEEQELAEQMAEQDEKRYLIGVAETFKTAIKLSQELAEALNPKAHRINQELADNILDLLSQGITTVPAYIRIDDVIGDDLFSEDGESDAPGTRYYWATADSQILVECPRLVSSREAFFMNVSDLDLPEFKS